jgi:hypothetical protein
LVGIAVTIGKSGLALVLFLFGFVAMGIGWLLFFIRPFWA